MNICAVIARLMNLYDRNRLKKMNLSILTDKLIFIDIKKLRLFV